MTKISLIIMRYISVFTLFLCSFTAVKAQNPTTVFPSLKIGDWQQHLPWQRSRGVAQSDTKVYYATEWALLEIEKSDKSARFFTKIEGLSDVGTSLVRYNKTVNKLLITYTNSNIDIFDPSNGGIENLSFIKKSLTIQGNKNINHVFFDNQYAYLSCGFGILKLNLENSETVYTVFTGLPVNTFTIYNDYYYAGTDDGVYRLPVSNPAPEDFNSWELMDTASGFPESKKITASATWNGALYYGVDNSLYRYDGNTHALVASYTPRTVKYLTTEGEGLMIGLKRPDNSGTVEYIGTDNNRVEIQGTCNAVFPNYGIEDGTKKFWFADETEDFKYYDLNTNQCERYKYNSPFLQTSTEIAIARNKVYVATPGSLTDLSPNFSGVGIYIYDNGIWSRFNGETNPGLTTDNCHTSMWRVTPHPQLPKFYVGSFIGGLIESNDERTDVKCYTQNNSILLGAGAAGSSRTAISGMAFDDDGNLWICNYNATSPIAVLKKDGKMVNFQAAPASNLIQVAIDANGYKWFVIGFNGGVMVYDSGADIDNPADDRYKILTPANSVLPTSTVNAISVDLDGDVWVGTQQGVVTFECGSDVFKPTCTGRKRIVNIDGFNEYLLEKEEVRTIAVDGANRKWFGTLNGIFVQSSDGLVQEANFTSTNSPLFDNAITDLAVNPLSGEVWIGTEKGIQTLRTEAVNGGKVNSESPYTYPNPVQPDYDGPIAIYGLARDANIKITDIAGNLIYEGTALGGQAIWNGRDYQGRRAASGVYLVMATSKAVFDDPDTVIAKIVILN